MVVVVVAGGLGDLGSLVVNELVKNGKHEVFILTRKVCIHQSLICRFSLISLPHMNVKCSWQISGVAYRSDIE